MRNTLVALAALSVAACVAAPTANNQTVISVIGTNDVHGELDAPVGGVVNLSGYVAALRERRQSDGAVLLLDAGDMWQGTLESNLSEGQMMIAAYNALGYDAAAIGNHEFDFGPSGDRPIPMEPDDDARGALKARAREAEFPLLAANLLDLTTGEPVAWNNVYPTVMVERSGIQIGVIGVTTASTFRTTTSANIQGLALRPLSDTIADYAADLRESGADLVIVAAHAGGFCTEFDDPVDLSSCDPSREIFAVARALRPGAVDQIVAGHHHEGIAHIVNGIAITSSFNSAQAFGRVDYRFDVRTNELLERIVYPPQTVCRYVVAGTDQCASEAGEGTKVARYEGVPVRPMPGVAAVADQAAAAARELKEKPLGVELETPITLRGGIASPLGRLMTSAALEMAGGDVAIHNVVGGIRANLPAGNLTFGDVYRIFPFDNRTATLPMTGADLRVVFANQIHRARRSAGVAGIRVFVSCQDNVMDVQLQRWSGEPILDTDVLQLVTNDFLLLGGDAIFTPVEPDGGFDWHKNGPLVRDELVAWFRRNGGQLDEAFFVHPDQQRWHLPDNVPTSCRFSAP